MKIVADHSVPYLKGVLEPFAEVSYLPSEQFTPENVREADALIVRSVDKCTSSLLEGSRVKLITTATIGFDHIDTAYCDNARIIWRNSPGCNAVSVAQYVLSSMLKVSLRGGNSLVGKTIGIVGVGHVGKEVERLCLAWGMRVLRNDPPRAEKEGNAGFVSLDTITREADIITLHVPYTREGPFATHHLADDSFFSRLEKRPWFINSCRGGAHDTAALLKARREGKVSELIIDCWEKEPDIDRDLLSAASVATPHIAGFSADGKANGTRMCLEEIERFFHVKIERLGEVLPPPPHCPVINLDAFSSDRVERAVFASFDPESTDRALRSEPESFEAFRTGYVHPREFGAYAIKNATSEEARLLKNLGFTLI